MEGPAALRGAVRGELMTVPTAMATGIEIKTQSRAVRRMVKERALQISPIQPI